MKPVIEQAAKAHAAALEASKPQSAPQAPSPPAKTVKMDQPIAMPQSAPMASPARGAAGSPLVLVGIAAGCLIAGIVLTIVALRLFG